MYVRMNMFVVCWTLNNPACIYPAVLKYNFMCCARADICICFGFNTEFSVNKVIVVNFYTHYHPLLHCC